jgi:protocatechuate 3,4-dioxygenase beta subunit
MWGYFANAVVLTTLTLPPPAAPLRVQERDAPQKTATARLSGRVTALDTGKPLRQVVVRAVAQEIPHSASIGTDAEGGWEITDLPAATYTLTATKGGYVTVAYGQKRPFAPGVTIKLTDKERLERLDFTLPRASVIAGRIIDDFNEPVTGARVTAMRYKYVKGQRQLTSAGVTDTSNDLGQYRLYGLSPGEYYVSAQPPTGGFMANPQNRVNYTQTFYPDAKSPGQATRLTLTVGQEAQEITITLAPTPLFRVSGTAMDWSGKPVANGIGALHEARSMVRTTSFAFQNGQWSVTGVLPGEYTLKLQSIGASFEEIAQIGGTIGIPREFAEMPVTVAADIEGLAVVTAPAAVVKGRVLFDTPNAPREALPKIRVTAREPHGGLTGTGRVNAEGTFEITGLSGTRIFRATTLPDGWALKSVILAGQDITDIPTPVRLGTETSGLELTLTNQLASLSGTVQLPKGSPASEYAVVLFPNDSTRWGPHSRYIAVAHPDNTGRFRFDGLLPASYLAMALEWIEEGQETDPEFLERLKIRATTVDLAGGEKKTLELKLVAQ